MFGLDGSELFASPSARPLLKAVSAAASRAVAAKDGRKSPIARIVAELEASGDDEAVRTLELPEGELLEVFLARYDGALVGHLRVLEPGTSEHIAARCDEAALTPRESAVARLAARGLSNSEIGRDLELATDTVKQHLRSIFGKARVSGRTELAAFLLAGWRPKTDRR